MGTSDEKWTEIICLLDRSGSMASLTTDTIGGFNAFIGRQQTLEGRARVSLVLFDDEYEVAWQKRDITSVPELDQATYFARGSTALLDAVGKAVSATKGEIGQMAEPERPNLVMVLVVTDGYENASREYSAKQVKALVGDCQEAGWEFVFLGADIDSFATSGSLGMAKGSASNYSKTSLGTREAYSKLSRAVSNMRTTGDKGDVDAPLDEDGWL